MNVALLGIGTIGRGVYEQISCREDIKVKRVLDLREFPELGEVLTHNFEDILNDPEIESVIELMGGIHPAYEFVKQSLKAGKNVVTANKLMLSYHLEELWGIAQDNGVQLRYDASVGGSIPFLLNLMRTTNADTIEKLYGIVNGTTNLILDTMQTEGSEFADVLADAQRAGYAEANPSADIDGIDARSKVAISSAIAFGHFLDPDQIDTFGIRNITKKDILAIQKLGYVCRLMVHAQPVSESAVCAFVEPELLKPDAPEAIVRRNDNLISFVGSHVGLQYFFGQGAGKDPTACAVVLGLTDILQGTKPMEGRHPSGHAEVDNSVLKLRYYVRTTADLGIPTETLDCEGDVHYYLTEPVAVGTMHALAVSLAKQDPNLFFAGIRA